MGRGCTRWQLALPRLGARCAQVGAAHRVTEEWALENFGPPEYPMFLEQLRNNGGRSREVPEGRVATRADAARDSSGRRGARADAACGGSGPRGATGESAPTGEVAPSAACRVVPAQALCAPMGMARALRYAGYVEQAVFLEGIATEILASDKEHKAAEVVDRLGRHGGWKETRHLPDFDPLGEPLPEHPHWSTY